MRKIGDQVVVLSEQDLGVVTGIMDGGERYRVDTGSCGENWYSRWDVVAVPQAVIAESEPRPHVIITRGTYVMTIALDNMGTFEENEHHILSALCGEFPGLNQLILERNMLVTGLRNLLVLMDDLIDECDSLSPSDLHATLDEMKEEGLKYNTAIHYDEPTITPVPDTTA